MPEEIPSPTVQAQIENLTSILRLQQRQINKLHQALVWHQRVFEELCPDAAALAKASAGKADRCASFN